MIVLLVMVVVKCLLAVLRDSMPHSAEQTIDAELGLLSTLRKVNGVVALW